MSWLITGGSGQLGIAVFQELAKRHILFDAWGSQDLDVTQGPIVRDVIAKLSPKVIINCAAWTDVDGAEGSEIEAARVNSDGAENLARAANLCHSKLIHISTDYVFSGEAQTPWQVGDEIAPLLTAALRQRLKAESELPILRILSSYARLGSIAHGVRILRRQ